MATAANVVKFKRSSVAGKIPQTTDLKLGELALNTYDGKIFLKKSVDSVETVVTLEAFPTGGTDGQLLSIDAYGNLTWITSAATSSGTVTSVSVASANGFEGTVSNSTTTPSITIKTSVTGLLKGNGTSISAATSGTDYLVYSSLSMDTPALASGSGNVAYDNTTGKFTYTPPDLSGYVTSSSLSTTLSDYVTSTSLSSTLGSYVTSSSLSSTLGSYVTSSSLSSTLSDYVTSSTLSSELSGYVTSSSLSSTLSSYVTSSSLSSTLGSYVTSSSLSTTLSSYVTSTSLNSELSNYVTSSNLSTTLSSYVTSSSLTTTLSSYVTSSSLTTTLSSYVTGSSLTTTLSDYAKSNDKFYLGTTQIALNRASGSLSLNSVSIDGNAGTANKLYTARNINGVSFDGSADISITASTTNALTVSTGLQLTSGTTFDGSSAVTISVDTTTIATRTYVTGLGYITLSSLSMDTPGSATGSGSVTYNDTNGKFKYTPPDLSSYITASSSNTLTNKSFNTADTGNVLKINGTQVSDTTGTGKVVLDTSPSLTTPSLGAATATTINKVTISAPASAATLTLADGSSLVTSGAYSTTLTSTGTTTVTLPTSGTLATLDGSETLTNKTIGSESTWNGNVVAVTYGGTGTSTGSITGTGALTFTAGGSDTNVNLVPKGIGTVDVASKRITSVAEPTQATDAATKAYVDAATTAVNVHDAAQAFADDTNTQITGADYADGTADLSDGSGIGATLTDATTGSVLVVDGYTLLLYDRVVVSSFSGVNAYKNGVYSVTTLGIDDDTKWVLTRATDSNNSVANQVVPGDYVFIVKGTKYAKTGWIQTAIGTNPAPQYAIKIGTDSITWTQFSGAGTYVAGTGLTLTGNSFAVNASQTQITAVGTLVSGTWNSSVIDGQYGGTGVNNTGKTITLGGNLTTSGAFTTTLTVAADTNVTLPSTGTLATTGQQFYIGTTQIAINRSSSSQTLNGVSIDGNAGTVTNGVYTTDTGTVTNTMLAGSIANNKLVYSSVTLGNSSVNLGGTLSAISGLTSISSTSFVGALTGNADTVTHGVYTTGTYSDPVWLTALAYSKLTGAPTNVSQFNNDSNYATKTYVDDAVAAGGGGGGGNIDTAEIWAYVMMG